MSLAITVQAGYVVDNTQKKVIISGRLLITGTGNYPVGGLPLDSVLLALPESTTNSGVRRCILTSDVGSGYIWQRIPATGKMMGLQVPPTGSLTTAAPLQQLPSTVSDLTLQNEAINFQVEMLRNA
jgi:hypothetical protein